MNKQAQLSDPLGALVLCRGCELSGELVISYGSHTCELCSYPEPLTVNAIEKLVALISRGPRASELLQARDKDERIAELLVANTSYLEDGRLARRKLAIALGALRLLAEVDADALDASPQVVALLALQMIEVVK